MNRWNPKSYLIEGRKRGFQMEYLNRLVKTGREISKNNIPVIYSLAHLANLSNTLYKDLHSFVSRANEENYGVFYKNFPIKKYTGGKRWISIPCPQLMAVQNFIAKEILNNIQPHHTAMSYVSGLVSPLKTNAEKHMGAKWLLKMDVINFFSNISERQVYDVFSAQGYPNLLSFEMARLCTRVTPKRKGKRWNTEVDNDLFKAYRCLKVGSLPQGSPTSPALSNLVSINMDVEFEKLAHDNNADYTRYADDLTFSFLDSSRSNIEEFKKKATVILHKYNFSENRKKTRIISPGARKKITGVVINSGNSTVPKEFRDKIRMHLYYANKVGIPDHCRRKGFRSVLGFKNHLYGLIMYVRSINQVQGDTFRDQFNKLPWLNFDL